MFRKAQSMSERSRSRLKSSEVKKLKGALRSALLLTPEALESLMPAKDSILQVKLRSKALVYIHEASGTPLFFDADGRKSLYPTVFVLWKLPTLLPLLATHCQVSGRILSGADLMLPGVSLRWHETEGGASSLRSISKGQKRAVIGIGNPMPFAVGESLVGAEDLEVSGMRGKGLRVLHSYGDLLCEMGNRQPPAGFLGDAVTSLAEEAGEGPSPAEGGAPAGEGLPPGGEDRALAVEGPSLEAEGSDGAGQPTAAGLGPSGPPSPRNESKERKDGPPMETAAPRIDSRELGEGEDASLADGPAPLNSKARRRLRRERDLALQRTQASLAKLSAYDSGLASAFASPADAPAASHAPKRAPAAARGAGSADGSGAAGGSGGSAGSERPSAAEMDGVLVASFLQALKKDLRSDAALPILANVFMASMLLPRRPVGTELMVRRSSFKKLGAFLYHMAAEGVVEVEESAKGVLRITAVHRDHDLLRGHRSHADAKGAAPEEEAPAGPAGAWGKDSERDLGRRLMPAKIQQVYRLGHRALALLHRILEAEAEAEADPIAAGPGAPDPPAPPMAVADGGSARGSPFPSPDTPLPSDPAGPGPGPGPGPAPSRPDPTGPGPAPEAPGPRPPASAAYFSGVSDAKGRSNFLSGAGARKLLNDYAALAGLEAGGGKMVVDAVTHAALFGSKKECAFGVGAVVAKKAVLKQWSASLLCYTAVKTHERGDYEVSRGEEPPKVRLMVERLGRHFLCHVGNLEAYRVDPALFSRTCSRRFAASASVGPGGEVQVQGNLKDELPGLLRDDFGVPPRALDIVLGKGMQKKGRR